MIEKMTIAEWRKSHSSPKKSKMHNKKDEGRDSRKESRREKELILMEKAGEISDLQCQVPFVLIPAQKKKNGKMERSCKYLADFVYMKDGQRIVEDTKSVFTKKLPVYVIKRKLLLLVHGIEILET